jgi:hypothetical protein
MMVDVRLITQRPGGLTQADQLIRESLAHQGRQREHLECKGTQELAWPSIFATAALNTEVYQPSCARLLRLAMPSWLISRGRMQEFLGRPRTNVSAIIRESPCPVLSV